MARNYRLFWESKRVIVLAFSTDPCSRGYIEWLAALVASSAARHGGLCVEQIIVTGEAAARLEPHIDDFIERKRERDDFDVLLLPEIGLPPCSTRIRRRQAALARHAGIAVVIQQWGSPPLPGRHALNAKKEVNRD